MGGRGDGAAKRRRLLEPDDGTLKSVFAKFMNSTPTLFNEKIRLNQALSSITEDPLFQSIHHMTEIGNLGSISRVLEPEEFSDFEIERDGKNRNNICAIKDKVTTVAGDLLDAVFLKEYMRRKDFTAMYTESTANSWCGYAFPRVSVTSAKTIFKKGTDAEKELDYYTVCGADAIVGFYVPEQVLETIIGMDYVRVEDYRKIYEQLNKIYKNGYSIDPTNFDTPEKVCTMVARSDSHDSLGLFVKALYGSHLKSATWEERLVAFETNPSVELAQILNLKSPMNLSLAHVSTKSQYQQTQIGNLSDNDQVLLSNNNVNQEFFQSVVKAETVMVYKAVPGVGIQKKKNQRVTALKAQNSVSKKDLLRILEAIEAANTKKPTNTQTSTAAVAVAPSSDLQGFSIYN